MFCIFGIYCRLRATENRTIVSIWFCPRIKPSFPMTTDKDSLDTHTRSSYRIGIGGSFTFFYFSLYVVLIVWKLPHRKNYSSYRIDSIRSRQEIIIFHWIHLRSINVKTMRRVYTESHVERLIWCVSLALCSCVLQWIKLISSMWNGQASAECWMQTYDDELYVFMYTFFALANEQTNERKRASLLTNHLLGARMQQTMSRQKTKNKKVGIDLLEITHIRTRVRDGEPKRKKRRRRRKDIWDDGVEDNSMYDSVIFLILGKCERVRMYCCFDGYPTRSYSIMSVYFQSYCFVRF